MIKINSLTKTYNENSMPVEALKDISLTISKGEFAAIAGPSGSGKTTLLNIIGGLDNPSSGTVSVDNESLNGLNQKQLSNIRLHKIGFIFQAYNLIPVLSAVENVEFVLLLQGVDDKERRARSMAILREVGLEKEVNRRPSEMSGGQQQRVAVARAIVSEPMIVLADEPTANLDQHTGASLLELMHDLNHRKNITFVFSTHDSMVMEKSDRIIYLTDGRIISDKSKSSK